MKLFTDPSKETSHLVFKLLAIAFLLIVSTMAALGQATVTTDKLDYIPGEYVIVTGTGWEPGETVDLDFHETPKVCTNDHHVRTTVADEDGNIYYDQFLINDHHLGVHFVLTATGLSSGLVAVTEFDDGQTRFAIEGLPSSTISVLYSINSSSLDLSKSITTNAAGNGDTGNFGITNGATVYFEFPVSVISGGDTYNLISTLSASPHTVSSSPFTSPNSQITITGKYEIAGGSGGLTVTAPDCAQGGSFTITYTPETGGAVTETRTTPYSFNVKKNTSYSISSIDGTVNGNTYTGSATLNGTTPNENDYEVTVTLTYVDDTAPVITTNGNQNISNDSGQCSAIVSVSAGATDNCDVGDPIGVRSDALPLTDPYPVGVTTITWNVTDVNGNPATQVVQTITVDDDEDPAVTEPTVEASYTADEGECSASLSFAATADDNCDVASIEYSVDGEAISFPYAFPVGTTTVDVLVTDIHDNTAATSFDVVVTDDEDPTVTAPTVASSYTADEGECSASLTFEATADDNCEVASTDYSVDGEAIIFPYSFPVGSTTVDVLVTDIHGNTAATSFDVVVTDDEDPAWTTASGSLDVTVNCGDEIALAAAQLLAPEATDNCGIASIIKTAGALVGGPNGTYTNTWIATDFNGNPSAVFTQVITVSPVTINADASSTPVPIGSNATLSATVTPAVANVTVNFYIDDVFEGSSLTNALGIATLDAGALAVGVYKITAIVGSGCDQAEAYLPVYDPNGGFVTGGGWINSPAGALASNPSVVGKANFGFVSKYKKGSNQVDGNTEFQFQAGSLNFKSSSHDAGTLVIAGKKAIYKGVGTINGAPGYSFMVSAIDGHVTGGDGIDRFRIKIWLTNDNTSIVYDNQMGEDENVDATTALGGGSIVIHTPPAKGGKNGSTTAAVGSFEEATDVTSLEAYPNPMRSNLTVRFANPENAPVAISMLDLSGRAMSVRITEVNSTEYSIDTENLAGGFYYLRLRVGNTIQGLKLLKQE